MASFFKVTLYLLGICFILSLLPTFYFNVEGFNHWVSIGGITENIIGFGVAIIVFFGLAVAFISLFAGLFVVFAMIVGGIILAGITATWPIVLLAVFAYLVFSRKEKNH